MPEGQTVILRLTIADPVPGVTYSLQDKKGVPSEARAAGQGPLSLDVPVRVADGPRFLGDFVRSEGPERRFVYIAIGQQAGDAASPISRRAKIDIHAIPQPLLDQALAGRVLEVLLPGRDKQDLPACASLTPIEPWRAV